tara:strand:+ start:1097 stop:1618 length:522 start_codon:yes stop_codon:yes gene_type:complete
MTKSLFISLLDEALGFSKPKTKKKDIYATARAKAKRIAKRIGVEIEICRIGRDIDYDVFPPKGIEDPFEYDGHICYDWNEVLDMVEVYEKLGVGVKITKAMAKSIAETIDKGGNLDRSAIRDLVDTATSGELDAFKLDMMTDWVFEECRTESTADYVKSFRARHKMPNYSDKK